jgi:ADP-ribose pyrophosphatase YjhB (NUDIX family)
MAHCNMDQTPTGALAAALSEYRDRWPDEAATVAEFLHLLEAHGEVPAHDAFRRERLAGHLTGSAWLVDRSGRRVLLTHHRKLDRWLQPGGHADGDRDLARVALTEACEETGLPDLRVEPLIFDIDRHLIPARGDVPAHWHYDVRHVVRAGEVEAYVVSEESHDLAWRGIDAIAGDAAADPSMHRMARKWLASGRAGPVEA